MIKNFIFGIIHVPREKLEIDILPDLSKCYGVLYIFLDSSKIDIESIMSKINSEFIKLDLKYPDFKEDTEDFDKIINSELDYTFDTILKIPGIWEFDREYKLHSKEESRLEETLKKIL